jgi:hypothetical protein
MVEKLIRGDSHEFELHLAEFGAGADSDITVLLRTSDRQVQELKDLTVEGGKLLVTITSSLSSKLSKGEASLIVQMRRSGDYRRSSIARSIEILPEIESEDFDPRSEAQQNLDAARRALKTFTASGGRVRSYTVGTRSVTYSTVTEIQELVKYWERQVYFEECARLHIDPRKRVVEFEP